MTFLPSKCKACLEPWCAQHGCQMTIPSHPAYKHPAEFGNTVEVLKQFELVYLASPYSKYPAGIERAFREVGVIGGRLAQAGVRVYSPIAHSHPMSAYGIGDPLDYETWLGVDFAIARACDVMVIATMPTWELSHGISEEIKHFTARGLPIFYIDPETLRVTEEP